MYDTGLLKGAYRLGNVILVLPRIQAALVSRTQKSIMHGLGADIGSSSAKPGCNTGSRGVSVAPSWHFSASTSATAGAGMSSLRPGSAFNIMTGTYRSVVTGMYHAIAFCMIQLAEPDPGRRHPMPSLFFPQWLTYLQIIVWSFLRKKLNRSSVSRQTCSSRR
jgi:hypothetical protein